MNTIRILIADDHPIVREGLRMLINSKADLELLGEAADGEEVVNLARTLEPDVILIDLVMPGMDGIEAIRRIKDENHEARILVLTSFAEVGKVFCAIKAGALSYLLKDSTPEQLVEAIHAVYQGNLTLHPNTARLLMKELNEPSASLPPTTNPLTEREVEVLKLVAQGLTDQEIAERLVLAHWTVHSHVRNILAKLHLANRTQAALYAQKTGLADIP
jgi:two-component system, NarL family, response regulator LiaR